jgi:hypothetical protein
VRGRKVKIQYRSVLVRNSTVTQLVKNCPSFYDSRRCVTVFVIIYIVKGACQNIMQGVLNMSRGFWKPG